MENTGSIKKYIYRKDEDGELIAFLNPEYKKLMVEKNYEFYLEYSKIPKNYWDLPFEIYEGDKSQESYKKAIKYAKNCRNEKYRNINLYVYGEHSSQKTTIACNIGKEFIRQGLRVHYIGAGDLIDMLMKNSGFTMVPEIDAKLREYEDSHLIIIDDAFDPNKSLIWSKNSSSNHLIVAEWDRFLRRLISNNVRIVITSNVLLSRMGSEYSDGLFQLLDRNFVKLHFKDSIKKKRQERLDILDE